MARRRYGLIAEMQSEPRVGRVAMLFRKLTGTEFTIVPYRAASDLVADVMADRIDLNFGTLPSTLQLMRAGSEKLYAVTSDRRSALVNLHSRTFENT